MKTALFVFLIQYLHVDSWIFTGLNLTDIINRNVVQYSDESEEINFFFKKFHESGQFDPKISIIYPGTKWCGTGDVANNYDDLGLEWRADKCCRAHDYCPDVIPAGGTNHSLINNALYTRLSCECDETFRKCLQNAGTYAAENVGNIYFNGMNTKCFREDYPIRSCSKRGSWPLRKCLKYRYDTNAQKVYQWFDLPDFR